VATIALAPMKPMPGMVSSRLLSSFLRCCPRSRFSIAAISAWHEKLARPVVRGRTRFHPDQARRQFGEERQQLRSTQRLVENHHVVSVSAMHLKHVLGQIDANRGNLHVDGPLNVIRLRRSSYGTSRPGAGAVHHINSRLMHCIEQAG
jgi:hypothetical protein